jgi:DivIVA domain-containing protein
MKTGSGVTVADIRAVTFRSALGGYEEAQVDAVLDALIELLLSLGNN